MDRLIIPEQATGFPETIESWEFLENLSASPLVALGHLIGQHTILQGVERQEDNGVTSYTDGYITYNGELLPFVGGVAQNQVSVLETIESVDYNVDINNDEVFDNLPAYKKRVAVFGDIQDASAVFSFTILKRHITIDKHLASLHNGSLYLGDLTAIFSDSLATNIEVSTPELPTSNYLILGAFRLANGESIADDALSWSFTNRTSTGFRLSVYSNTLDFTGVIFEYHLVSTSIPLAAFAAG